MKWLIVLLSTKHSSQVPLQNILTIVHAMTKLFILLCLAHGDESNDMNCLAIFEHIVKILKF